MGIFSKKDKTSNSGAPQGSSGFGVRYQRSFTFRPLPGAGAGQYSWDTLVLPRYTPIGWGQPVRKPMQATAPAMSQRPAITLTTIGNPGILAGQFITQPLLSTEQATAIGLITPGNSSNPFNVV